MRLSVQAYQQAFAHYAGWDWPTVRREAARFEAPIGKFRPAYLEEMRGIADGAGLDLTDVLAINVRTEVMYAAKARQAPRELRLPPSAAPSPSSPPPASRSVTLGQNWDWLLHAAQTLVVLEARQDDGPDFVTVVEAGLLAKTGMNAAGLGLVTNALVTDADVGEPGLPYHVLLRAVLDCDTVTDALEVLQAGLSVLLGQLPDRPRQRHRARHRGRPRRLHPPVPAVPRGRRAPAHQPLPRPAHPPGRPVPVGHADSAVRLQRLRAATPAPEPPLTLDDLRPLLPDHADHPYSICAHPDPRTTPASRAPPSPPWSWT